MGSPIRVLVSCGLLLASWGCASDDRGPILARDPRVATSQVGEMQLNIRLMLSFDANKDGLVTRDEVEAGLRASNWKRPAFGVSFGRRPGTRDAKATWALEINFPGAPNLSSLKWLKRVASS